MSWDPVKIVVALQDIWALYAAKHPVWLPLWACEKKNNQDNSWLAYRTDLGIYGWGDKEITLNWLLYYPYKFCT